MGRRGIAGALTMLLALALLPGAAARPRAATTSATLPRVTLIGDSIAEPILNDAHAQELLGRGVELVLEIALCRRVEQASCPDDNGVRAPNVVDLVRAAGPRLGRTVIVAVGYNDFEDAYAHNVEDALAALRAAGVTHVLWPDYLRNARGRLVLIRAPDGVHYEPPAGDMIARAVLARLNRVFDLTSWRRRPGAA